LRHGEAVFAAFLHPRHRFGKAGEDLVHGKRLGAAVALAAVQDRALVGGQNIIHQRGVIMADHRAMTGFDCLELESALGDDRPQRSRSDPGETNSGGDDDQEREPQGDRPPRAAGSMGGFGYGHLMLIAAA